MITFSEAAKEKILAVITAENIPGLALRIAVAGRGPGGFQYDLGLVRPEDRRPDDEVFDAGGFEVYVDAASAPRLNGAQVDYVTGLFDSGFKIDNPNSAWSDPVAAAVQRVIDTQINPGVAMHGGWVILLEVKDGVAYIALSGGCQGCGMAHVTLKQGIEVMIKNAVPEIREVLDQTDHAGGTNPYYQGSQQGQSALT